MARGRVRHALRYLHGLFGRSADDAHPDRTLLDSFATQRDERAFATLVERHGSLVWGVCKRILAHEQDAEDAFQATFLVLARKAGSVSWRDDVGNWLYAVAIRVARKARVQSVRQRELELAAGAEGRTEEMHDPARTELSELIDEEVSRLPEKYRRPIVLCCFQGKTYVEAARLLGWPEGTASARLSRARDMLRRRLLQRGLALSTLPATFMAESAVSAMAPDTLVKNTARSALLFVNGQSDATPAILLAEGVLRTMVHSKLKMISAAALVLALLGIGVVAIAHNLDDKPQVPKDEPTGPPVVAKDPERPALPKAWEGRWIVNPFAGAEWFEVRHSQQASPVYRVYNIKDPKVVAKLIEAAKVTGVQNDMHAGCIPSTTVVAHFAGGKSFKALFSSTCTISWEGGTFYIDESFFAALNKAASELEKAPVDLGKFLPAPEGTFVEAAPKVTAKSLESGFTEIESTYLIGRQLYQTVINDEKTLAALHKSFTIVATLPPARDRAESRNLRIVCKDKAGFYFQVQNRDSILDFNVGKLTIKPDFFAALNKEISSRAGFEVDVTANDNKLPDRVVERAAEISKRLTDVKKIRWIEKRDGVEAVVDVEEAKDVAKMMAGLRRIEAPPREVKLKKSDRRVELTLGDGRTIDITWIDAGKNNRDVETAFAAPLMTELAEVSDFGQVWIDNQWFGRFRDFAYLKKREAKQQRDEETARLVCKDFSTFLKHIISVEAHDGKTRGVITGDNARAILQAIAKGKFEALDWNRERWQKEFDAQGDDGLEIELSPGLGYSLPLIMHGEKEMLIPMVGRVTFDASPMPIFRKAIENEWKEE
jgi:RNA polymerase sigma factor (sigma-70 family)